MGVAAVRVCDDELEAADRATQEGQLRPVAREPRPEVVVGLGVSGEHAGDTSRRIDGEEVTVLADHDRAVAGEAERWWQVSPRPDHDDQERRNDESDDREDEDRAPRGRDHAQATSRIERQPAGRARPPPPLARGHGLHENRADVVGHPAGRVLPEPGSELPFEVAVRGHAGRPSEIPGSVRASASSAARRRPMPRWSRDFTVPRGSPSVTATSVRGSSKK